MTVKKRYLIPIFILLILLIRLVSEIGPDKIPGERFKVVGIVDGDTVDLLGGDRLRLVGIDCPEKGEQFYDSAKMFIQNMTLGKIVQVDFSKRRRDGYGRMLGYTYVDSVFVNAELVRSGLAYVYLYEDNLADSARIEELLEAQNKAIDSGRGLWTISRHKEPYYLARKGSYRFHRPECASVKNLQPGEYIKFDSRLDACRQGYSPCRNCKP